jgi:hypothetical protein
MKNSDYPYLGRQHILENQNTTCNNVLLDVLPDKQGNAILSNIRNSEHTIISCNLTVWFTRYRKYAGILDETSLYRCHDNMNTTLKEIYLRLGGKQNQATVTHFMNC